MVLKSHGYGATVVLKWYLKWHHSSTQYTDHATAAQQHDAQAHTVV
jgi:hypothetical protein